MVLGFIVLYSLPRETEMVTTCFTPETLASLRGKAGCYKVVSEHGPCTWPTNKMNIGLIKMNPVKDCSDYDRWDKGDVPKSNLSPYDLEPFTSLGMGKWDCAMWLVVYSDDFDVNGIMWLIYFSCSGNGCYEMISVIEWVYVVVVIEASYWSWWLWVAPNWNFA